LIVLSALIFSVSCRWIEIPDNYGNQIDNNVADFPGAFRRSYRRSWGSSCECGDGSGKTGTWHMIGACSKGSKISKDCKGPNAIGLQCCLQGNYWVRWIFFAIWWINFLSGLKLSTWNYFGLLILILKYEEKTSTNLLHALFIRKWSIRLACKSIRKFQH